MGSEISEVCSLFKDVGVSLQYKLPWVDFTKKVLPYEDSYVGVCEVMLENAERFCFSAGPNTCQTYTRPLAKTLAAVIQSNSGYSFTLQSENNPNADFFSTDFSTVFLLRRPKVTIHPLAKASAHRMRKDAAPGGSTRRARSVGGDFSFASRL